MRYARTDQNQLSIIKELRSAGIMVHPTHRLGGGFPDFITGFRGELRMFELKNPLQAKSARALTPAEKRFHLQWAEYVHVVETFDEAFKIIKDGMSKPDEWFSSDKVEPEKGTLNVSDLKPAESENRGHGNENLGQVAKDTKKDAHSKPRQTQAPKKEETKATAEPAGNPDYSDHEEDPFKTGELKF
jgi:hypothetical protein